MGGVQGAKNRETRLHRPGREENLGNIELAALKPRSDFSHRGDEPLIEDLVRLDPRQQQERFRLRASRM